MATVTQSNNFPTGDHLFPSSTHTECQTPFVKRVLLMFLTIAYQQPRQILPESQEADRDSFIAFSG